jgi:hypothetical protein
MAAAGDRRLWPVRGGLVTTDTFTVVVIAASVLLVIVMLSRGPR